VTEQQIADIKVRKIRLNSIDSGGAYRIVSVEIGEIATSICDVLEQLKRRE